jgi:hypothetical protein
MSESTQSLLTLLGLIFGSVIIFVVVLLWWVNRYIDKLFDHQSETLD